MNIIDIENYLKNKWKGLLKLSQAAYNKPEKWLYSSGILSAKDLCLPYFLGIGAQKAGTTWLHENLRRHPDLYLPEQKELQYFDWGFHRSLKYYSNKLKSESDQVIGEITPGYSIIPLSRIRFIKKIIPDVRLIFLMRNPIERAWSQALMNLITRPNRNYEEIDESEFYAHFKAERSIRRGDYQTILNNWLSVFPHQQLYIGFFEDIKNRPKNLLKDIFAHIGVSIDVDLELFPYNSIIYKGPDTPIPERYKDFLNEMYRKEIESLYQRFGDPVKSWRCL